MKCWGQGRAVFASVRHQGLVALLCGAVFWEAGGAAKPTTEPVQMSAANAISSHNVPGQVVAVSPELLRQPQGVSPDRYVVQKGDTLWDISSRFLANPWLWPEIWLTNPQIANPHLIYPGDVVSLEWINGRPRLRIERNNGAKKLQPLVRTTPLPQPVPAIPMDAIHSFIQQARFIGERQIEESPYVLMPADGHLMAAEGMDVFARALPKEAGDVWQMMRAGQPYYDPVTNELLGREGIAVGTARVLQAGDPARLQVETSLRETLPGDLLLPVLDEEYNPELLLQPVAEEVEARVVAGFDVITRVGQYQIVTLNCGSAHNLQLGATFEGYAQAQRVQDNIRGNGEDVMLPGEYRGLAVVFRIDDKVAHALVMRSEQPMQVGDHLRSPLLSDR